MGIFVLLKNKLMVVFDAFSRLSSSARILVIHLFFALVISDGLLLLN